MKKQITEAWNKYYKSVNNNPRKLLVKSIKYVKYKAQALDLGAGNLRDTVYLIKKRFKKIDILDKQQEVKRFAKKIGDKRITTFISSFEKFDYNKKYDLINAQYALPFMKKSDFMKIFSKIKKALNKSGVITGQFFGIHDSWKNKKDMTFLTEKEAKKALKDLKIIYFLEEEKDGITALGEDKHWHVFHFIAIHR